MNINNMSQSLRLREYYYMFLRHKRWFYLSIGVCVMISTVLAFTLPKVYRSDSVLLIEDEKILKPLVTGLAVAPTVAARVRNLREELLSWPRLTLLAEKLELNKNIKNQMQYEKLIKSLRSRISIKIRGHDLITLSYSGPSPKECQSIVETLSAIIMQGNLTSVDLEANTAIQFIKSQLDAYRQKLEQSETDLRKFRELYNSVLPVATRMNEQLVQMKIELSKLLTENTEEHPRVVQTRKMITQIETQRDEFMKRAKNEGVDISADEFGKLVSSTPLQEQELAKLQRDYAVNEAMYQKLLGKLETAKISQTLEDNEGGAKFRVLEPARLPLQHVKPNKMVFIIGGFFAGAALGALAIFLLEQSNDSIRTVQEASEILTAPVFGAIQTIRTDELILGERLRKEVNV